MDRSLLNVLLLSFGFMLVFTAFQTMSNIEKTILTSIHEDYDTFNGDAFVSLAIIYGVFASCNWLAPSYISVTGPRTAILTGACCYALFIASFFASYDSVLYVSSVLVGIGAALIWTGHGQYLTENSDDDTMARNAGLFWAIFQMSMFAGNLFVFFIFTKPKIDAQQRTTVFIVLSVLAVVGTVVLTLLRRSPQKLSLGEAEGVSSADKELRLPEPTREKPLMAAWNAFTDAVRLFFTSNMLLLSLTFLYVGLELTFCTGVYSSSVGFVEQMGDNRKSYVGLCGIFLGIGEVVGGALFGILMPKFSKNYGSWPVVVIGLFMHLFAFISIFLNLPNDASFGDTTDVGIITPSPILAMAGSLTLGLGDACYNTQIYSLLGVLYVKESAPAFALFKFCQSIAAAVSFLYSTKIGVHVQLTILLVTTFLGTGAFCYVEYRAKKAKNEALEKIDPALVDATSGED